MRCWGITPDGPSVALPAIRAAAVAGLRPPSSAFKLLPAVGSQGCLSTGWPRTRFRFENHPTKTFKVKALEESGEILTPIAPLKFESPIGQLLSQIMQTDPHLLPAAIDQQLESLQSDKDALKNENQQENNLLYRRIAEVKQKEKKASLEDIIYCLVVHKFMENGISMIPGLAPSSHPTGLVDYWPNQEQKLEAVHSSDALEMIHSYQTLILRDRAYGLKSYVKYLDGETLQNYATTRSKESKSLVEKQTQALFGKPDIRIGNDGSHSTL